MKETNETFIVKFNGENIQLLNSNQVRQQKDYITVGGKILGLRNKIRKLHGRLQIWQCSEAAQNKIADIESQIFELESIRNAKRKESRRKQRHACRNLGDNSPFNEPFKGSVEHHLDKHTVINMPEKLHQNIPHSLNNDDSMEEINKEVMLWFTTKDKRKASNISTNIDCTTIQ